MILGIPWLSNVTRWRICTSGSYSNSVVVACSAFRIRTLALTRTQERATRWTMSYSHNQERQPVFVSTQYNHTIMYKIPIKRSITVLSFNLLPGPTSSAPLASAVLPNSLVPLNQPSYYHWTIWLPIAIQSTPSDYSVPMHHQMLPELNDKRQDRVPAHYNLPSFGEVLPSTRL